MRLIVMGVSGCGKSTLAAALGQRLSLQMVDGDDLHLAESVAKMRALATTWRKPKRRAAWSLARRSSASTATASARKRAMFALFFSTATLS
jgi:gluconate kinase